MTTDREGRPRPSPDEIASMLALAADDPIRREWERDPQHRAIVQSYEAFLEGREPEMAQADEAEAALRRRLADELPGETAGHGGGASTRAGRSPAPSPVWTRWVAVAAALVIVVGAGWLLRPDGAPEGPTGQLRGEGAVSASSLALAEPRAAARGDWILAWSTHPGAEIYRVVFYGPDLEELRVRTTENTQLRLSAQDVRDLGIPLVLWRVEALREGDLQGRSEIGSLRLDAP